MLETPTACSGHPLEGALPPCLSLTLVRSGKTLDGVDFDLRANGDAGPPGSLPSLSHPELSNAATVLSDRRPSGWSPFSLIRLGRRTAKHDARGSRYALVAVEVSRDPATLPPDALVVLSGGKWQAVPARDVKPDDEVWAVVLALFDAVSTFPTLAGEALAMSKTDWSRAYRSERARRDAVMDKLSAPASRGASRRSSATRATQTSTPSAPSVARSSCRCEASARRCSSPSARRWQRSAPRDDVQITLTLDAGTVERVALANVPLTNRLTPMHSRVLIAILELQEEQRVERERARRGALGLVR